VAVLGKPGGEERGVGPVSSRQDSSYSGAHWSATHDEFSLAADDR
jgi:hypothetical protein